MNVDKLIEKQRELISKLAESCKHDADYVYFYPQSYTDSCLKKYEDYTNMILEKTANEKQKQQGFY